MQPGISTYVFLPQRLTPALLDALAATGAQAIEVFAARHHFNYGKRTAIADVANWFRSSNVVPTMHMPLYPDTEWSRHLEPSLNLIAESKAERIDAQDEIKRALEAAEQVPFRSCVLHLGLRDDHWDTRALDDSLTAIEHLKAFASPLGVQLLLENLPNRVATPEHLVEIARVGHFDTIGFCLDTGHANLVQPQPETSHEPARDGLTQAFETFAALGNRLVELHLHDNHGGEHGAPAGHSIDEHLWPGHGIIDWRQLAAQLRTLNHSPRGILEIANDLGAPESTLPTSYESAWKLLTASVPA
jgi:sugar phosphate isomerase/epimerase